ncbi:MAG TPA: EAL domain-containing protein [Solirubrobacteraceae bacterium]|nr:EAL domain-containing protein [Solirubrobacteraceae bacterium]
MSPLLSLRAPVTVTARMLGACAVTAGLAAIVAFSAGSHAEPSAAVPATLAAGSVCAALVAHLLHASARTVGDHRLVWMAAGVTVALAGLVASLLGQPTIFPGGGPVGQGADAAAARYAIWHTALLIAGALAVAGVRARPRSVIAFTAAGIALLALSPAPFGERTVIAVLAAGQLVVAAAWWRRAEGAPTWGEVCVIALIALSALDAGSFLLASEPYAGAWWASLTLLAAQFAVPAVGLVIGFVAVSDRLRDLQEELGRGLEAERERARREEEIAGLDRRHRAQAHERIARLADGRGLDIALQPIVALDSGGVVGAEALARFTDEDGRRLPTEETFVDAHALGLGIELELAVVELALSRHDRLPEDLYLACNVSPAVLTRPELAALFAAHDRPLVVELTEHHPVEDYAELDTALASLRRDGARVAVDDVGSGFASFRHVTRVRPEILKLDRTLVCGIDEDPVRQSLASAIVAFARDVGATVVSEGIESEGELTCLVDLSVGCGQGFLLGRPEPGPVESSVAQLVAR